MVVCPAKMVCTGSTAVAGVVPWRIGDGVRRAIAHAWTLNEAPTIDEVRERGQGWAPGRSYATALLWRSLTTTEGTPA